MAIPPSLLLLVLLCLQKSLVADHLNGERIITMIKIKINVGRENEVEIEIEEEVKVGLVKVVPVPILVLDHDRRVTAPVPDQGRGRVTEDVVEEGLIQEVVAVMDDVVDIVIETDVVNLVAVVGVDHAALLVIARKDVLEDLIRKIAMAVAVEVIMKWCLINLRRSLKIRWSLLEC